MAKHTKCRMPGASVAVAIVLTVLLLAAGSPARAASKCGGGSEVTWFDRWETHWMWSSGLLRAYKVYIKGGTDLRAPQRLLFNWHPLFGSPDQMANDGQMNSAVWWNDKNYIVVYPQGWLTSIWIGYSHNAGSCCDTASASNRPDVQFAKDLIEDVDSTVCIDRDHMFSTGFSNGAGMSWRLACEEPELFRGIAPVSAPLGLPECDPEPQVPVLAIYGTNDPFSNAASFAWPYWNGVPGSFSQFEQYNGCSGGRTNQEWWWTGSYFYTCDRSNNCAQPSEICTIYGMGHEWPPASFNTSARILNFFDQL